RPLVRAAPGPVLATFQVLEVINDDLQRGALLARSLVVPLLERQVPFDENLLALAKGLFHAVGEGTGFAAVEHLALDENGLILPLSGLRVLAAVVDGEAKIRHLAAARKHARLGVARQTTDQHHFVEVGHGQSSGPVYAGAS